MLLLNALMVSALFAGSALPVYAEEGAAAKETVAETVVTEAPVKEAAPAEAPVTEAPVMEAPVTETPVTEAPVTEAPVTETPVTEAPVTENPVTEAPVTEVPVTEVPVTEDPAAETSATEAPVTEAVTEFAASEVMTEETTEKETEALFSHGYATVKKDTAIYREKTAAEEARIGLFTEKSVVYVLERFENDGDKTGNSDWMHVVFAVDRGQAAEITEGYVRAGSLLPYGEETEDLVSALTRDESHVVYQGNTQIPLTPAAFEEKEEALTEEETEESAAKKLCEISASWENETLGIGDEVTLTAVCEPEDTVMWQSSKDGEVWEDIARGQVYIYELTEENYQLSLRAVADAEEVG